MAISTVRIANFALSMIGTDSTIESLTENSTEAKECNLWMDHSREKALAAFNWTFARVRATLAAHTNDPPAEWAYRYVYPADCLKARFIENPVGRKADPVPFDVEQSTDGTASILTDLSDAKLIYTKDVTEPTKYSHYFIELLATLLASHIAHALTGKIRLGQFLGERSRQMLIFASALDASEKQEAAPRDAPHTRGRD